MLRGIKKNDYGYLFRSVFSFVSPNAIKGWKRHRNGFKFDCSNWFIRFVIYDDREKSETFSATRDCAVKKKLLVQFQCYAQGLEDGENILLNFATFA